MKKALTAMRSAVRKTLKEHKTRGLPIYVWQDNRIVRIPPEKINPR